MSEPVNPHLATAPDPLMASAFEKNLTSLITSTKSQDEVQSGLLLTMVREIHAVKWILIWVLILVPAILAALMIVMLVANNGSAPTTTSLYGGY